MSQAKLEGGPPASVGFPLIRVVSVRKVYRMGEQELKALDGVTLDIKHGEFVAIMGSSGSGKSTMMNLIGALDVPTSGQLFIDGRDVSTHADNSTGRVSAGADCVRQSGSRSAGL